MSAYADIFIFCKNLKVLDFADANGVRAFRAVADLKRNLVSFLEFSERNVLELVGMEEKILRTIRCSGDFDEAESLLVHFDDCSFFHTNDR